MDGHNLNNRSCLPFKFIVRSVITIAKRSRLYEKRIDYITGTNKRYSSILISKLINYIFNGFSLCARCFQSSEKRRHLKRIVDASRDENTSFV